MPKISEYRKERNTKEKKKATDLYKQGLTLREVGKVLNKSHEWVRTSINELSTDDKA